MRIHRIETGKVRIRSNQITKAEGITPKMLKVLLDNNWSEWLPIYAWAIEHPEGVIVVDTGETHKTGKRGYLPRWHPYYSMAVEFDVRPEDEIGPQLKKIGIDPVKDVRKVVMTHLHTDHAGGLHHFPNSEIFIEQNEYKAASGFTGILAGYLPHRWPDWLKPKLITLPNAPYHSFPRSLPVTSDGKVMIVGTPGHVAHHISVIVEIENINYFLAGDTSYNEENLLNLRPDGVGTRKSLKTLKSILSFAESNPTVYLPSHDPQAPDRMEGRRIVPVYDGALAF
ncbi:MAG: N-acyl homoserine lactonase family protein [Lewinellaceae bacterium]|nr:N-acyl homoserine lactonase family protein [Lewinellaceae bacterium]